MKLPTVHLPVFLKIAAAFVLGLPLTQENVYRCGVRDDRSQK
ncbi:hypothetical protein [Rhizobium changzhiense]|nr:hypothetical protein [Rhizobium changzhiense]